MNVSTVNWLKTFLPRYILFLNVKQKQLKLKQKEFYISNIEHCPPIIWISCWKCVSFRIFIIVTLNTFLIGYSCNTWIRIMIQFFLKFCFAKKHENSHNTNTKSKIIFASTKRRIFTLHGENELQTLWTDCLHSYDVFIFSYISYVLNLY